MPISDQNRLTRRDQAVIFALVVAAFVAALPGFHLLEHWMPQLPAIAISHGIGVILLGAAAWRWRVRRRGG